MGLEVEVDLVGVVVEDVVGHLVVEAEVRRGSTQEVVKRGRGRSARIRMIRYDRHSDMLSIVMQTAG